MAVGRPLQFDPDQALNAALAVFWQHGYESTSLQDLLNAMQLSKSSFYQAFGNKQALFERCIQQYRNDTLRDIRAAMEDCDDPLALIEALYRGTLTQCEANEYHWGCLVMNTASEFSQSNEVIAEEVTRSVRALTGLFEELIVQGQALGTIHQRQSASKLSLYLMSNLSGLHTLLKTGISHEEGEAIIETIVMSLK
jgi:TetR/AcrR family transcriptional repressor of nem operon